MDKKSGLSVIIGALKPSGKSPLSEEDSHSEPDMEKDESGVDEGELAAAEEVLSAIKSNDAEQLCQALKDLWEMFDASPHVEGSHE